jgi:hypothetical protein
MEKLTEEQVKKIEDLITRLNILCSVEEFQDNVLWWNSLCAHQKLSEDFIREFKDKVDWTYISIRQNLSEDFIREFQDKVDWDNISEFQKLSEDFIREFQNKVNWLYISEFQKLSEDFIREFQNKVNWNYISRFQKLSEDFIREFQNRVNWDNISEFQKLSEDFIREFQYRVDWDYIPEYQKLSKGFIKEFKLTINKDNWLYKTTKFKKNAVIKTGLYECYDDYFIAYKGIRSDRYSRYNFQYQYLPGNTYESHADFTDTENSFGLSAWTESKAKEYCGELVVHVKIRYEDVARIVHNNGKIRCTRQEVLD